MKFTAWGNYPVIEADTQVLKNIDQAKKIIKDNSTITPYGSGRSYGDQALSKNILLTNKYNYITAFDKIKGTITCQCGVTLEEILDVIVPEGWFLPVTPGTKFITTGGAIASDVHGKNHHKEGTFCDHVISMNLLLPSGEIKKCSRKDNSDIFHATCGGNGLTGLILDATFSLKPIETAYIKQRAIRASNIDELIKLLEENESYTYSVAWIDCVAGGKKLGRGILLLGEHAEKKDLPVKLLKDNPLVLKKKIRLTVPFYFPNFILNKFTINIFNFLYFNKTKRGITDSIIDYNSFFYPLDAINNWNRIYGKRGFTQYQFVVPRRIGTDGVKEIVERISKNGMGSFLSVLKIFGPANNNHLSFPMEGYTLALDFPIKKKLFPFFEELDKLVENYGGRLYATKDVRMDSGFFQRSYSGYKKFKSVIKKINSEKKFASIQSERLKI